ncbi:MULTISPECIES: NAD-dependent epimerase/dehydratase family protein [unclassified Mesorhizobium]|nr:MAG: NAD-dependent epimerase/dehydratase family protein [Mesorhizobium sp.]TIU98049.1 MAG: NAD-dependent epimerase/dehydratase family protein [Mesorhizobium sp.]TIX94760.1 MAG: NAD-dependent epimerase/dehydratase family protein [Mesorhizobium sp.]
MELARAGSILVTGAAGFLGYHVALRLGRHGIEVVNVDNFTPLL